MYSLLDSIIDGQGAGGNVVSEQHDVGQIDVGKIDWDARLRTFSGVGDWSEMGITREAAEAAARAADTPAAREKVLADLRARAIKRAGLDTSNGRVAVMVAGEAAWHRLGVNVRQAVDRTQAIHLAGLDWKAVKVPLRYTWAGAETEQNTSWALVREDTGKLLSVVGSRYKPIQNADAFEFLDSVLGEFGGKYHTAGSLYGGEKVWIQAEFPKMNFFAAPGDEQQAFVTWSNDHTGAGCAHTFKTCHRVVCANTHRIAYNADRKNGLAIRHTGSVKAKVEAAREALGLAMSDFNRYHQEADSLVFKVVNVRQYAGEVLDAVLEITAARESVNLGSILDRDTAQKRLDGILERRTDLLGEILEAHESKRCLPHGTAWAGYQAVSEVADHGSFARPKRGTSDEKLSRRFESVLAGESDALKQAAYQRALNA